MATEITTTSGDITGDFDLIVEGSPTNIEVAGPTLLKALGAGGTGFKPLRRLDIADVGFVKNTGTNAYKLDVAIPGLSVMFSQ